jgi:hypothetical protein
MLKDGTKLKSDSECGEIFSISFYENWEYCSRIFPFLFILKHSDEIFHQKQMFQQISRNSPPPPSATKKAFLKKLVIFFWKLKNLQQNILYIFEVEILWNFARKKKKKNF